MFVIPICSPDWVDDSYMLNKNPDPSPVTQRTPDRWICIPQWIYETELCLHVIWGIINPIQLGFEIGNLVKEAALMITISQNSADSGNNSRDNHPISLWSPFRVHGPAILHWASRNSPRLVRIYGVSVWIRCVVSFPFLPYSPQHTRQPLCLHICTALWNKL